MTNWGVYPDFLDYNQFYSLAHTQGSLLEVLGNICGAEDEIWVGDMQARAYSLYYLSGPDLIAFSSNNGKLVIMPWHMTSA